MKSIHYPLVEEDQHVDSGSANKTIYRDETHFHFDGFLSGRNIRNRTSEDLRVIVKNNIHMSVIDTDYGQEPSSDSFSSEMRLTRYYQLKALYSYNNWTFFCDFLRLQICPRNPTTNDALNEEIEQCINEINSNAFMLIPT